MQLEYIFQAKNHERNGQTCCILHYSPIANDDTVTVLFSDGTTVETKRNKLINKDTVHRRKRKPKLIKIAHPDYDTKITFHSFQYNRQKLKRYLKQNRITMNDLFNTFISNL